MLNKNAEMAATEKNNNRTKARAKKQKTNKKQKATTITRHNNTVKKNFRQFIKPLMGFRWVILPKLKLTRPLLSPFPEKLQVRALTYRVDCLKCQKLYDNFFEMRKILFN